MRSHSCFFSLFSLKNLESEGGPRKGRMVETLGMEYQKLKKKKKGLVILNVTDEGM